MQSSPSDYLAQALGGGGGVALSYGQMTKGVVREHLLELALEVPSLDLGAETYTHVDGREAELLQAKGTIPISYQDSTYNIPVAVWVPEQYPEEAPIVYVVPVPGMIIKPRHACVDGSGFVRSRYLEEWGPTSSLYQMVQDLATVFSSDPPLFSRPLGKPRPAGATAFHGQNPMMLPGDSNDAPLAGNAAAGFDAWSDASQTTGVIQPRSGSAELASCFRELAVATICKRLHASLAAGMEPMRSESIRLAQAEADLLERKMAMQREVASLQSDRLELDDVSQRLTASVADLDRWMASRSAKPQSVDVLPSRDEFIVASDLLANQALSVQAEDLALEDALYALDKAVNSGVLTADVYLKQVRLLCRRQFSARVLSSKVSAAQRRQPGGDAGLRGGSAGAAPRPSQREGVRKPAGDSWLRTR